jgi:predicted transcriptional regulator
MSAVALNKLLPALQAKALTGNLTVGINGCYISDLLSDVLAHAGPGVLWMTVQTHRTVVSVAATKDCSAVLFTCGRSPANDVIAEAEEQGIALLTTRLTTYEAAGQLWETGIRP